MYHVNLFLRVFFVFVFSSTASMVVTPFNCRVLSNTVTLRCPVGQGDSKEGQHLAELSPAHCSQQSAFNSQAWPLGHKHPLNPSALKMG